MHTLLAIARLLTLPILLMLPTCVQVAALEQELESSRLQWAQERASLQAVAEDVLGELQRTHEGLGVVAGQVGAGFEEGGGGMRCVGC